MVHASTRLVFPKDLKTGKVAKQDAKIRAETRMPNPSAGPSLWGHRARQGSRCWEGPQMHFGLKGSIWLGNLNSKRELPSAFRSVQPSGCWSWARTLALAAGHRGHISFQSVIQELSRMLEKPSAINMQALSHVSWVEQSLATCMAE